MRSRALVGLVVAGMIVSGVPAASVSGPSPLRGRIVDAAGSPVVLASVLVSEVKSGETYWSPPTGENGSYSLEGVPKGTYHLAVRTEQGLFPGDQTVSLDPENPRVYFFKLQEGAGATEGGGGGDGEDKAAEKPEEKKRRKGVPLTLWINPLTVALAGVAIVIATSEIIEEARNVHDDDEDRDGSPSVP